MVPLVRLAFPPQDTKALFAVQTQTDFYGVRVLPGCSTLLQGFGQTDIEVTQVPEPNGEGVTRNGVQLPFDDASSGKRTCALFAQIEVILKSLDTHSTLH